jgi:hypothetical protein
MFILLNIHVCPPVVDTCSWCKYWCLSSWTFMSVLLWWIHVDRNVLWDKHQYLRHEHVSTTGEQTWTFSRINISTYAMNMYPPQGDRHECSVCSWHKYWCLSYWTFLSVLLWWIHVHGVSTDVYPTERSCLSSCGGYMLVECIRTVVYPNDRACLPAGGTCSFME